MPERGRLAENAGAYNVEDFQFLLKTIIISSSF